MASAEIGSLRVTLGIDSGAFTEGLSRAQKQLQDVGKSMQNVGRTLATVGAGMTAAITAPLIAAGFAASKAATEAADAMGQVEAALTSMGGASGKTKDELAGLADGLMRNSLYDDDDILRSVTANLLTFGKVAGDVFDRAQVAVVDLATRMKMDLQSATVLIGKALNDPVNSLSALGRTGAVTKDWIAGNKERIAAMVQAGNVAGAQALILGELERQYAGSAKAAQDTDPYDKLRDSLNTLSERAGAVINRFLVPMTDAIARALDKFTALSPQMQTFAVAGLAIAAALGPALIVVGAVVGALGAMATALATGGVLAGLGGFALAAAPFVAAAAAIAAAIYVFRDDLGPVFAEFGKAFKAAIGPSVVQIMAAARQAFAALGPAISAVVAFVGPLLAGLAKIMIAVFGPIVVRMVQVLAAGIGNAFAVIGSTLKLLTALLNGDWAGAWNAAGSLVMTIVRGIGNIIEAVFPGIGRIVGKMVEEVKNFLGRQLFDVFKRVIDGVKTVSNAFFNMYDAVVGHSYVPDMVEGIASWMAKLDAGMVVPAVRATDAARSAFESLRDDVAGIMEGLLTDTERAARDLARQTAIINRAVADPRQGLSRATGDQAIAGLAGQNLTRPELTTLNPMADGRDIAASMRDGLKNAQQAFDDTARRFGDQFAENMERVLRGDIRGAFMDMLSDALRSSLADVGTAIFKSFGSQGGGMDFSKIGSSIASIFGGKGGGFDFSKIGSTIASLFGGFKLPGFKDGGSILPGGSGGIDSQVVAFRNSPSEKVDIYDPRRMGSVAAGGVSFDLRGAVMTSDLLRQMESMASSSSGASVQAARHVVPADMARTSRYSLGRR